MTERLPGQDPDPMVTPGQHAVPQPQRIPVIEEQLQVGVRQVDLGGVRIERHVEERTELVDEPLMREALSIERRPVGRMLAPEEVPKVEWRGDTLVVPVFEEVLVMEKRLVLKEEVLVHREQTEFRAPQHVVLRREHVSVSRLDADGVAAVPPSPSSEAPPADFRNQLQGSSTMTQTLIGVFDTREDALQARDHLLQAGFPENDVTVRASDGSGALDHERSPDAARAAADTPHEGGIAHFFRTLFGRDDAHEDIGVYSEALRRGGQVVSVDVDGDADADRAADILRQCGAIDLDERQASWRSEGWSGSAGTMPGDDVLASGGLSLDSADVADPRASRTPGAIGDAGERQTIPVVQEDLAVGKREVRTGGVRVFTRVREIPVEETLQLREEHARVERHPVDRPATEADLRAMSDGVIEVRESAEEAVVRKNARVVEEVEVGKDVAQRSQTVRDTVRRTEVDVENLERDHAMARDRQDDGASRPAADSRETDSETDRAPRKSTTPGGDGRPG